MPAAKKKQAKKPARPISEEARAFAEQLVSLRKAAGISRRELAFRCGTAEPSLSPYEKGQRIPRLTLVQKLAAVLKVDPLALVPWWRPARVQVEVCQRAGDWQPGGGPKYHAQIAGKPGMWAAGISVDDAVGNLVRTHSAELGMDVVVLEGCRAR